MKEISSTLSSERFHALDALRGFALVLGIGLHVTISFLPGVGTTGWPIIDISPSTQLSWVFYVIHIFRMTLFFVIAGFFAHMLFHRQGTARFIKERSKRILIPLVVGWIALIPLVVASMLFASKKSGIPLPPPPSDTSFAFPLAHLWFLWFLSLCYVAMILARNGLFRRIGASNRFQHHVDGALKWLVCFGAGPIILSLPIAISLYKYEAWLLWAGVPTPDKSLVPNLPAAVAYGTAFVFGWLLHRQTDLLSTLSKSWLIHFLFAISLTAACAYFGGTSPATSVNNVVGIPRMVYALAYSSAAWCWTYALLGFAVKFLSEERPRIRYLSDSSYWLYLAHLPLVFLLQGLAMHWQLPWSVKYVLILSATISLLMLSYKYLVRSTLIGGVLNGRRYTRGARTHINAKFS